MKQDKTTDIADIPWVIRKYYALHYMHTSDNLESEPVPWKLLIATIHPR